MMTDSFKIEHDPITLKTKTVSEAKYETSSKSASLKQNVLQLF